MVLYFYSFHFLNMKTMFVTPFVLHANLNWGTETLGSDQRYVQKETVRF
jgi:hypothetical protein